MNVNFAQQTANTLYKVSVRGDRIAQAAHKWGVSFLKKVGAFVRRAARSSMRKKPKGVYSPPGKPPFSHPSLAGWTYRDSIFFELEPVVPSVVIGPARESIAFGELHEHGGRRRGGRRGGRVYPARPVMGPAFEKGLADVKKKSTDPLPPMWHGAVRHR